jgi:hypothetical protein
MSGASPSHQPRAPRLVPACQRRVRPAAADIAPCTISARIKRAVTEPPPTGASAHRVEERRLLRFYWDGLGPTSWVAGLVLIGNGKRRYLSYWNELESYLTVAAIEPSDDPLAISGTLQLLLSRNGRGFGVDIFGSLPTETTNHAPLLVEESVIRQAYFDLIHFWERDHGGASTFGP